MGGFALTKEEGSQINFRATKMIVKAYRAAINPAPFTIFMSLSQVKQFPTVLFFDRRII
jgi:hypothetical protein